MASIEDVLTKSKVGNLVANVIDDIDGEVLDVKFQVSVIGSVTLLGSRYFQWRAVVVDRLKLLLEGCQLKYQKLLANRRGAGGRWCHDVTAVTVVRNAVSESVACLSRAPFLYRHREGADTDSDSN